MSNGLDAALRPATARLYRLAGSAGSSPSIRRAPRDSQRVQISPFTSSSACSVDACVARVELTWSLTGRPSARVRLLDAARHSRA